MSTWLAAILVWVVVLPIVVVFLVDEWRDRRF
jgi:hypothetical protein